MSRSSIRITSTKRRRRAAVASTIAAFAMLASVFVPLQAATAAGDGVLGLQLTPTLLGDSAVLTDLTGATTANQPTTMVSYRVEYSCSNVTCEDVSILMHAPQPDPNGLAAQAVLGIEPALLWYDTWVAPFPGATITHQTSAALPVSERYSQLIQLGDLNAGDSGSFQVIYRIPNSGTYASARASQFYPEGFQIVQSATISSPTAVGDVVVDAGPVTWHTTVPEPAIVKTNPGTVRPDVNVTYSLRMGSGAFIRRDSGSITGVGGLQAAGSWVVVDTLPEDAVYVSSTYGGVYDAAEHTVTWELGTAEDPDYFSAGGWGSHSGSWSGRAPHYGYHAVTVQYPASAFTSNPNGCDFVAEVTNEIEATVTYVDDAGTVKVASTESTHEVACYTPFGRLNAAKASSNDGVTAGVRQVNVPPDVTGEICPASGRDLWNRVCTPGAVLAAFPDNVKYWEVVGRNAGNVPGVITVEDSFPTEAAPVHMITTSATTPVPSIEYTFQCGAALPVTETVQATSFALTAGQRDLGCAITHAFVTSGQIAAGNIAETDTGAGTAFTVRFYYSTTDEDQALIGVTRDNSAFVTVGYPDHPELGDFSDEVTNTVHFRAQPQVAAALPRFTAAFPTAAVVDGGGLAVPERPVTFTVGGSTANIPADADITPEYVFIAPVGWRIQEDSAAFAPDAVPAGVSFSYETRTIGGVEREVVVASWPNTVVFGENVTLPPMTVVAVPTFAVGANTNSVATAWVGDSRGTWDNTQATYTGPVQDADTERWFSSASQTVTVYETSGVAVIKEVCTPDDTQPGDCAWSSDSSQPVPVSTTADNIQYRVTIQNTGNTQLAGVVAYDVLPWVGDHGLIDGTVSTPRGSDFDETLQSVSNISGDVTLTYSPSTEPYRPEVYTGSTDPDNWSATLAPGTQSIRAAVGSALAPGDSVSFEYAAAVGTGATTDSIACNSVAVVSSTTLPSEPPAVCAITAEADLEITVPEHLPLQIGRDGVVPFLVENLGGSISAPGTVTVTIPAGLEVTSLTPDGWDCTADPAGELPIAGEAELTCTPTSGILTVDVPVALDIPVVPTATGTICVDGSVTGTMVDPNPDNNDATACTLVVALDAAIKITKDDGLTVVAIGNEVEYTLTADNGLVGEAVVGAVITDELPDGVEFVSATGSPVLSGQNVDGSGGTLTWPAVDFTASGTPSEDGDTVEGNPGSSVEYTVTVRVLPSASGQVTNQAAVTAPDPADAAVTLSADDTDVDDLRRLTVAKVNDAHPAGVRIGDEIEYTVTLTNSGTADYTAGDPAVLTDDLNALLDDATFVAGSAEASVDGGTATTLADPVAGLLGWSGALDAGTSVVVTYRVTAGDGEAGDELITNTAYSADEPTTCVDGLDAAGFSCASTTTYFAPVFAKRIDSLTQADDGTWTIVYALDVVSLNPDENTTYDLADDLAFGAGIDVTASVTDAPDGVTAEPWTGAGPVATGVVLPADAVHTYLVTAIADAHEVAGTAAAVCAAGLPGGFANVGTLTLTGDEVITDEACASPVAPTVDKTVAVPTQNPDGTWSVEYTVTVTNPHTSPATGLSYTLEDALDIVEGITVSDVQVTGPGALNSAFDGVADTAMLTAPNTIAAAPSASAPSTDVYTVSLTTQVPAGEFTASELACPPAGTGGYANTVTLLTGDAVLDTASACADATPLPTPTVDKSVVSVSIDGSGLWSVTYDIVVANADIQFSTVYSLEDALAFAPEVAVSFASVTSSDATVNPAWNGASTTDIVTGQALPAAGSHTFRVSITADPSELDPESPQADCRVDDGETGTGYRNLASVTSGASTVFAEACEPATDPSVVKTTVGTPVQDPATGLWTVQYQIDVTNRSALTVGTIPYALTDEFGFPADVDVVEVDVQTTSSGVVNAGFDGVDNAALATGEIGAAPNETTPARHTYTVTATVRIPGGIEGATTCDAEQGPGGLRNETEITVGSRTSGSVACADLPDVPVPGIQKSVLSQKQQEDGTWVVLYRVTVANPSSTVAVGYDLEDELALGAGIAVVAQPTITAVPTGVDVNHDWDGAADIVIVENVLLPAAGSHQYTLRAVIDSGDVFGSSAAGDCVVEADEGTGFLNYATLDTGVATNSAQACARAWDPGVTKTANGEPVQQADGSWLLSYTITVQNPAPSVPVAAVLTYGLNDELDFPVDTEISVLSAAARAGGPAVNADWNGTTDPVLVSSGTALPNAATHIFDITVRALLPEDQGSTVGGWQNTAIVSSSTEGVVESDAVVVADIELPELSIEKSVTADSVPRIGDTITYEVTVTNSGLGDFTALYPAVVWDDLAGLLDDASFDGGVAVTPDTGVITPAGDRFNWTGSLVSGADLSITYEVIVTGGGDAELVNVAFAAAVGDDDPPTPTLGACDDGCDFTVTGLPALFIEKSVDVTTVTPGGAVQYRVLVTNTGLVDLPADDPATFEDDLAAVLSSATLVGAPAVDRGTAELVGTTIEWSGALAVGESVELTYSVRVLESATAGTRLMNVAVVDSTLPTLGLAGEIDPPREVTTTTLITELATTGASGLQVMLLLASGLLGGGALLAFVMLYRRRRLMAAE